MSPSMTKPIVNLSEKPIEQPRVTLKVPVQESSCIQDKIIPIPDYTIPQTRFSDDSGSRMVKRKTIQDVSREIPRYQDHIYRLPPKPTGIPIQEVPRNVSDSDPEINTDFEENWPFQEDVNSEMYQRPDKSHFQEPQELDSLINTIKLVHKFLPKQADIDKIFKIIQRKVLKGIHLHLPVTVKEIQTGYLIIPYFKDLYLYLAQNKLPRTKTVIYKVEMLKEKYMLLVLLLFTLVTTLEKTALLAIPEICANKIITLYQSSLFAGHQGVIKHI